MSTISLPPLPGPAIDGPGGPSPVREAQAGARSQAVVYASATVAMLIVCGAADSITWGLGGAAALAIGVAIGLTVDLAHVFRNLAGAFLALVTTLAVGVLIGLLGSNAGSVLPLGLAPLAGLVVLGLDWSRVGRLRPLTWAFGLLVIVGVAGEETWTYPAAVGWLALALAALASLEADRRAAQPPVVPTTSGPMAPEVQSTDLVSTILIAVAVALVAAVLLSTPSCQRDGSGNRAGRSPFGSSGGSGGSGRAGGSGSGSPGNQSGNQSGNESGNGSFGTGSGSTSSNHLYVPDPNGRFLIPNNGTGGQSGSVRIPSPERLPGANDPPSGTLPGTDGTITYRRAPDGTVTVTVDRPGEPFRRYTYRERSDGLTEIRGYDRNGNLRSQYWYDPKGRVATDDPTAVDQNPPPVQKDEPHRKLHVDGRLVLAIVLGLLAIAGIVALVARHRAKPPPPPVPPWALRLARDIEHQGRRRGRARRGAESLTRYGRALAAGPLPDPRIVDVADVVSTALFGRDDPGPQAQEWAETTWADIVEGHPPPGRAERKRVAEAAATGR